MFRIERYSIPDLMKLMKRSKTTVLKWLKDNKIAIQMEAGSKYVLNFSFDLVYYQSAREQLERDFPDNWQELYVKVKDGEDLEMILIGLNHSDGKPPVRVVVKKAYTPKSDFAKGFLNNIHNDNRD
jgi:hypothetical protein